MPEQPTPQPKQVPEAPAHTGPIIRTYADDLARAMDTTEASVVQDLLRTAREREQDEIERARIHKQKGWYTAGGIILLVLALGAAVYGAYYFKNLTVPIVPTPSVGIFQSTTPIDTASTDIATLTTALAGDPSIASFKPLLVPLTNASGPLSVDDTLSYLGIDLGEPFAAAFGLVRLGVYRTDETTSPFLIFYAPNPEIASKELLIAEPKLLQTLAPVLRIDTQEQTSEVGASFTSSYMYNLPVRTLITRDLDTNTKTILLYYGYATDQTIVIASNPQVLKTVYDTIIKQR